jgi:hypothetical protein
MEVYRDEGMLSPGRTRGESSDVIGVPPWSLVVFRLGCRGDLSGW